MPPPQKFLNEEETIQVIWRVLSHGKRTGTTRSFDPFMDDVAWFSRSKQSRERYVISKADLLVSDTDVPPRMSPQQIGFKAITAPVSDFAAKGVRPSFCLISLALSRKLATESFVKNLARGFDLASKEYRMKILAGDTSGIKKEEEGLVLDVGVIGFADHFVKRNGARPGDLVGVSGSFGLQSSGLSILLDDSLPSNHNDDDAEFRSKAIKSVLEPRAQLDLGLRVSKYLTSSIDSSDGLALSLYHLAEASRADFVLEEIPKVRGLDNFATRNQKNANELALFGGEEYELVITFKPQYRRILEKLGVITIGRVRRPRDSSQPKVYWNSQVIPRRGWIHNNS